MCVCLCVRMHLCVHVYREWQSLNACACYLTYFCLHSHKVGQAGRRYEHSEFERMRWTHARTTYCLTSLHQFPLISPPLCRHPPPLRGPLHPSAPGEGAGAAGGVSPRDSCSCWSTAGRPAPPSAGKGWNPPPVHAWSGGCCTSSQRGPGGSARGCVWCWWPRPARPAHPSWGSGVARWGYRRLHPPSAAGRRRSGTAPARRRSAAGERCSEPWRRSRWRGWTAGCRLTGPQCGWTGSTAACCRRWAAPLRQEDTQRRVSTETGPDSAAM